MPTINYWINHYNQHFNLDDEHRSGRPSKLHQDMIDNIVNEANNNPFTTPKEIKYKLDLQVSSRTVRRSRLDENNLHGLLAADEYDYSDIQLYRRENFGKG